jgi:hypothetical protein
MTNRGIWSLFGSNPTTVLSTGLNSLGNGTMSAASATYANQTNLDLYCDIEVNLASLSPTAGAYVSIYVLAAVDGSNFPAQSDADLRLTSTQLLCVIPIGVTATTAQRVAVRNLLLPPQPVQFKLDNQTGVALNASGNTVKIDAYSYNLNG